MLQLRPVALAVSASSSASLNQSSQAYEVLTQVVRTETHTHPYCCISGAATRRVAAQGLLPCDRPAAAGLPRSIEGCRHFSWGCFQHQARPPHQGLPALLQGLLARQLGRPPAPGAAGSAASGSPTMAANCAKSSNRCSSVSSGRRAAATKRWMAARRSMAACRCIAACRRCCCLAACAASSRRRRRRMEGGLRRAHQARRGISVRFAALPHLDARLGSPGCPQTGVAVNSGHRRTAAADSHPRLALPTHFVLSRVGPTATQPWFSGRFSSTPGRGPPAACRCSIRRWEGFAPSRGNATLAQDCWMAIAAFEQSEACTVCARTRGEQVGGRSQGGGRSSSPRRNAPGRRSRSSCRQGNCAPT